MPKDNFNLKNDVRSTTKSKSSMEITQYVMSQQVLIASMIFYVPNVINRKLNSYFIENMP